MNRIVVLVLEDEAAVREALERDLTPFAGSFRIEVAEDAADARELIAEIGEAGDDVGLILCDHLLPGMRGTDFLVELNQDPATAVMRKVLVTGQAGHEDTIRAINEGGLDHYIAKPWVPDQLQAVVRHQLTEYVLATRDELLPFVPVLDGPRLLEAVSERGWDR
jgi:two-component system chemotaxis response regulator CheY